MLNISWFMMRKVITVLPLLALCASTFAGQPESQSCSAQTSECDGTWMPFNANLTNISNASTNTAVENGGAQKIQSNSGSQ